MDGWRPCKNSQKGLLSPFLSMKTSQAMAYTAVTVVVVDLSIEFMSIKLVIKMMHFRRRRCRRQVDCVAQGFRSP